MSKLLCYWDQTWSLKIDDDTVHNFTARPSQNLKEGFKYRQFIHALSPYIGQDRHKVIHLIMVSYRLKKYQNAR